LPVVGLQLLHPLEVLASYLHLSILAARHVSLVVAGGMVSPSVSNLALEVVVGCRHVGLHAATTTTDNSIFPVSAFKSCDRSFSSR
jgi:hypothetical protein